MDAETDHGAEDECYWIEGPDGWWVDVGGLDPRAMTLLLLGREARWVTMTASRTADHAWRLIYRWEVSGRRLNIVTTVASGPVDSIADLLPAAAWTERELHERFAIEFVGRVETPCPMVRQADDSARFSHPEHMVASPFTPPSEREV
ncbi:MAG TPA: NADH-quinone oxidoreductase subunit C [Thermoleophilia bacterium]|nr:NADH-quinone oxidoreductase subunit C [Thermoleophilia bacterium]